MPIEGGIHLINEEKKTNAISKFLNGISEQFMNGLITLAPPAITIFVVMWILNITEGQVGIKIKEIFHVDFPCVGIISILFFIWLVGFIFGHTLPQKVFKLCEYMLDKIPVVKFIYSSVKQVSKAIFESNSAFQRVVLVPYNNSLVMGFLLKNIPDAVKEQLGEDYVCVFMPWSLNMTAGMNLFVKRSELILLDMDLEDGLQFVLTAGTSNENDLRKK